MQHGFAKMVLVSAAALTLAGTVWAQERTESASLELLFADEPLVFTASKKAQRIADAPAAVTVLTEDDIRRSGATTIPELLRSVPGVDVMESNQSQANVSIRGLNRPFANKLLVMVDGRSIYKDFFGNVYWHTEPLLLSQIARIEVVRGPGSALYGANAFNGVINIITKTPQELTPRGETAVRLLAAAGTQNSTQNEIVVSGTPRVDTAWTVGYGYKSSRGWGGQKPGAVVDDYSVPAVTLDVQRQTARGDWRLSANRSDARAELSSPYISFPDSVWAIDNATLSYTERAVSNPLSVRAFLSRTHKTGSNNHLEDVRTKDLEVQRQQSVSHRHNLVLGGNYRQIDSRTSSTGPKTHANELWALYAQDEYQIGPRTTLFSGLRLDHHNVYGTNTSPRLSLVHHPGKDQTLRASYGSAFRAPTIFDIYLADVRTIGLGLQQFFVGNPDVKPETIRSAEIGYRIHNRRGFTGISLFDNQVRDLIDVQITRFLSVGPQAPPIPIEFRVQNIADVRLRGLEWEGELRRADGTKLFANYAYLDARRSDGKRVDFSPRHKANVGFDTSDRARVWGGMTLHYVDTTYFFDNRAQYIPVKPYTRVDARLGLRFGTGDNALTATLSVSNALNKTIYEVPVVSVPGAPPTAAERPRTWWLSLRRAF